MFISIYRYKINVFFNEVNSSLNNEFLYYGTYSEDLPENKTLFLNGCDDESIELFAWDSVFDFCLPGQYWRYIKGNINSDKEISSFDNSDYYYLRYILNNIFCVFDLNKENSYYRKELDKFYYQYQVSHYKGNDNIRTLFLRGLFSELWLGDSIYNRLSVNNNELIYTTENGISYNIYFLVNKFCDIIRCYDLPENFLDILENIKSMMHESIDFILGENGNLGFNFDDVNLKYIDINYFVDTYQKNKEEIFNVLKYCVRDSQSFSELFISHIIVMNYSFFAIKDNPDDILLLKSFLSDNEEIFIKILSLAIDIGFYVRKETFNGLNLEIYLEKIEESDFLIDGLVDK
ncbi:hypothetical protein [Xenorhabdus bovienii]|uniref:hypothetical protein n=1 Tax=Xenorhabdus bovienii TaxID=40576 RepID=UPI0023B22D4A|nr:hypothetical protein [Xenorhabdus bovienii]MDE9488122.1 hypothetical protein [Xenorhabdus bovienii]